MIRLLVSVRSVAEASVALHHGVDLIDVKEPSRGALGMSSSETISAIARELPPRVPVSVALGEWLDWRERGELPSVPEGISYLKIGLAGARAREGWREEFGSFCREVSARVGIDSNPAWVAAAYADGDRAHSPAPEEVLDFASAQGFSVFLLDTWRKDGQSLFDLLGAPRVLRLVAEARLRGMETALAGSLRLEEMARVLAIGPDIVAVRSAACRGQSREAPIEADLIESLVQALAAERESVTV